MSEDFTDKVRALLDDPEMLAKIAAIAGGLGGTSPSQSAPPANPASETEERPPALQASTPPPALPDALKKLPAADPRLSLLKSLKPFLRADRQSKLDNLTRALTVASLVGTLGKDKNEQK
jgi:hypothetical protein